MPSAANGAASGAAARLTTRPAHPAAVAARKKKQVGVTKPALRKLSVPSTRAARDKATTDGHSSAQRDRHHSNDSDQDSVGEGSAQTRLHAASVEPEPPAAPPSGAEESAVCACASAADGSRGDVETAADHDADADADAPPDRNALNSNLFIRGLPLRLEQESLETHFAPYGAILSSAVMRNIHTGESLGTAFVRYATHEEAAAAIAALNGTRLEGRALSVQWAKKHEGAPVGEARKKIMKLFVRNIPLDVSSDALSQLFGLYGHVVAVSVHKDTAAAAAAAGGNGPAVLVNGVLSNARERRIAFITYDGEGAAEKAAAAVHNTKPFAGCLGVPLMVKLAEENYQKPERSRASGSARASAGQGGGGGAEFDGLVGGLCDNFFAGGNGLLRSGADSGRAVAVPVAARTPTNAALGGLQAPVLGVGAPPPPLSAAGATQMTVGGRPLAFGGAAPALSVNIFPQNLLTAASATQQSQYYTALAAGSAAAAATLRGAGRPVSGAARFNAPPATQQMYGPSPYLAPGAGAASPWRPPFYSSPADASGAPALRPDGGELNAAAFGSAYSGDARPVTPHVYCTDGSAVWATGSAAACPTTPPPTTGLPVASEHDGGAQPFAVPAPRSRALGFSTASSVALRCRLAPAATAVAANEPSRQAATAADDRAPRLTPSLVLRARTAQVASGCAAGESAVLDRTSTATTLSRPHTSDSGATTATTTRSYRHNPYVPLTLATAAVAG